MKMLFFLFGKHTLDEKEFSSGLEDKFERTDGFVC